MLNRHMSRRWDWYDWEGRRPLLATVICVVTIVVSGKMLLRDFHLLPPLISASEPTDHLLLRHTLKVVEPALNLLGAIYLWMMHRFAAPLFAAEAILITVVGFYLSFIDPSPRIHSLQAAHPIIGIYAYPLAVVFEFALTVYVWRITMRPLEGQVGYSEIA